jgi:hypothetical protein
MISVLVHFTGRQIRTLISSAVEGGIRYWGLIDGYRLARRVKWVDFLPAGDLYPDDGECWDPYDLIPLVPGCALRITDRETEKSYWLGPRAIARGLRLIAQDHPRDMADILAGDADADTADHFFQLALFGQLIYG